MATFGTQSQKLGNCVLDSIKSKVGQQITFLVCSRIWDLGPKFPPYFGGFVVEDVALTNGNAGISEHEMDFEYSTEEGPAYLKDISERPNLE